MQLFPQGKASRFMPPLLLSQHLSLLSGPTATSMAATRSARSVCVSLQRVSMPPSTAFAGESPIAASSSEGLRWHCGELRR